MIAARDERGLGLVNLVIGLALMMLLLVGVAEVLGTGFKVAERRSTDEGVEGAAYRSLDLIADALNYAGADSLIPDLGPPYGGSSVSFSTGRGYVGGSVQWSPANLIEWRSEPTDPEDGVDNNRNGIIDEGVVVRCLTPGSADEGLTVLARGVSRLLEGEVSNGLDDNGNGLADERGFSLDVDRGVMTIRLTLVRAAEGGRSETKTVETSIALRN